MSGVIEAKIRVPKHRLGDLVEDLVTKIPYAQMAGVTIIVPSEDRRRKPVLIADKPKEKVPVINSSLTKSQMKVIQAILEGANSKEALIQVMGIPHWSVTRMLNNLKTKKLIKGHDGTYTVLDK